MGLNTHCPLYETEIVVVVTNLACTLYAEQQTILCLVGLMALRADDLELH